MKNYSIDHMLAVFEKIKDGIRFNSDPAELLQLFLKEFVDVEDCDCYFRTFLCLAIEDNHLSLVTLLLTDEHCDLNSRLKYACCLLRLTKPVANPLFTAVHYKRLDVIHMLLRAGSSVHVKVDPSSFPAVVNPRLGPISCMEYAKLLKQQDIISVLETHDNVRINNLKCIHEIFSNARILFFEEEMVNPLHVVINLIPSFAHVNRTVADVVQQVIDAGANVHDCDSSGLTPLNVLIGRIIDLCKRNVDCSKLQRSHIVDTMRVLLDAGAKIVSRYSYHPLVGLLNCSRFHKLVGLRSGTRALANNWKLSSELIELLLSKRGIRPNLFNPYSAILKKAEIIVLRREKTIVPALLKRYNDMLDALAKICLCFCVDDSKADDDWIASNSRSHGYSSELNSFFHQVLLSFFILAGSSSLPGRSKKLFRVLLSNIRGVDAMRQLNVSLCRLQIRSVEQGAEYAHLLSHAQQYFTDVLPKK